MTQEQEKFITEKIKENWTYKRISEELNIDRRKISNWCAKNNLKSTAAKRKNNLSVLDKWSKERRELFVAMYTDINYGCYKYTYSDLLKEFTEFKDRNSIQNTALRLGLKREEKYTLHYNALNYEQRKYIIDNNDNKNVYEISIDLQIKERTVIDFLKSQGIEPNRVNPRYKKDILLKNPNFKKDYEDLTLSCSYVSSKWNLNSKTIVEWRKQDYGDYMHRINGTLKRTRPEVEFEDILIALEVPYFYQWKIDKWTIDYYLGHKICIEIDGIFWHSIDRVKEKDTRKIKDLNDKGYTVINFTEDEIYNEKEKVITTIKEILPFKVKDDEDFE